MIFKLTHHALNKYSTRTGTKFAQSVHKLRDDLNGAKQISIFEACRQFSISEIKKGDTYWLWKNFTIKENILAIVRLDGTVATVLTERIFCSKSRKPLSNQYIVQDDRIVRRDFWFTKQEGRAI